MSEPQYLELTKQRVSRLADLLAEAIHVAKEVDGFGAPGYRKRANNLRGAIVMFADCLPSSTALEVADEVRVWSGQIDGDDARSVALRSLLRYLDPSGSPKVK